MSEGAPSRAAAWFGRQDTPALVHEMGELAQVLRDINDQLHDVAPALGDISESLAAARHLRQLVSQLPQADGAYNPDEEPDPDAIAFNDHSPLSGEVSPVAPPLRMAHTDGHVTGTVTFGRAFEGPPGHVHGGWVASCFDEVMGMAQALNTDPGMTARLDVAYRRPTPLGAELVFDGWVEEIRGRKIITKATLHHDGQLLGDATGLFVVVDFDAMRQALVAARPPA